MGLGPYELTPLYPVGNPSHWHDFMAAWPLLFTQHLMSLVFDGAFERHPDLTIVFTEGAFSWVLPSMWRMDAYWNARRSDVPWVKRKPSEYIKDHVRFTTQPLEDPEDTSDYVRFLDWLGADELLMFSTDYPHWSYDDPAWAMKQFPKAARDRIMYQNALRLYRLPDTVSALPDVSNGHQR
jgi:predicted TIM-barrel fold metal-dependent hydrolase